jgi:hypothetical protein
MATDLGKEDGCVRTGNLEVKSCQQKRKEDERYEEME